MSKQIKHEESVPDLFIGMSPEERKEAEEALLRYFGLLWWVAGERAEVEHVAKLSPEMQKVADLFRQRMVWPK